MKCKMFIYHYECFNCDICSKKFQPGDEYLIKENNLLICKEDFLNNELSTQSVNRITSTPASLSSSSSLTVNINYKNLINSDDSSFSPSVSSSSIESLNANNNNNNNNKNSNFEISPLSVNYNNYSQIDHNSNDYNYHSLRGKTYSISKFFFKCLFSYTCSVFSFVLKL